MANSRVEVAKVESSRLMKDLIEAMDQANEAEAKMKEIFEQLRTQKILKIQKDQEIQSVVLKIGDERGKAVADF